MSLDAHPISIACLTMFLAVLPLAVIYLNHLNHILKGVPDDVRRLAGMPWTVEQLKQVYDDLDRRPIDYTSKIPPKLDRRYIVTGGNGLVGGFIVLQLLARGTPPGNIRIVDLRKPQRTDLLTGLAREVESILIDIRSTEAVNAAFGKPWEEPISNLPLTVFHTAAVILASDRSKHTFDFAYAVNVRGTENVLAAARAAGANVFSSTSSASISIRPVNPWVSFTAKEPKNFWQLLDVQDFDQPLKNPEAFYGNYPASKAMAERIVCDANDDVFRTGCIRPANGVYGDPTDNTLGGALSRTVFPTWVDHIFQSFVHGANVAIAHLQHEAVLLSQPRVNNIPQAGRPFIVTDPNPPITYGDLYTAIETLSIYPFHIQLVAPAFILVFSYFIEWYNLLPYRVPLLANLLPPIKGDTRSLQPGLFSICTHLIACDSDARKPVAQGGLGYEGVMTTIQGMVSELREWNREHQTNGKHAQISVAAMSPRKMYTTSTMLADHLRQAGNTEGSVGA